MSRPDGYLVPGFIDADVVLREVARGFKVTPEAILSDSRELHVCVARCCAMAVVRQHTNWSWRVLGQYFGRDRTSVRVAVDKVESNPELSRAVQLVVEELSPPPRLFAVADEMEAM